MATPKTQREIDQLEKDLLHDAICTEDAPCPEHGGTACLHCGHPCIAGVNSDFCSMSCEQAHDDPNIQGSWTEVTIKSASPTTPDMVRLLVGYSGLQAFLRGQR